MTSSSIIRFGAIFICAFAGAFAQTPQPAARRTPGGGIISRAAPDAAAVARGQKVFVAQCGFCHGSGANGGESGPDLIRSVLALDDENGNEIGPVILKGRPDKGMPAFNMTQAQISDIAAFLRSRQQAAINRGAYPILNLVTGDAKRGEAFFNGAGKCHDCHSPTGDFAGLGKKYDATTLQSRFLFPNTNQGRRRGARAVRKTPTTVTVTLASGKSISGELQYLDDFDVALRDDAGDYHSFTRDANLRVDVKDPLAAHEELLKRYTDAEMHDMLAYLVTL